MSVKSLANTPISVLDLAKISPGMTLTNAFAHLRETAQLAERVGYKRFWLAEHHNAVSIASAATSILITHIAEHTKTIRVGSGGIMLPNHSPYIIAEQFGTLAALFPERIDLGLGRAPGTDQLTMQVLRRDPSRLEEDFGDLIRELLFYFMPEQPGQKIKAFPGQGTNMPIYILGSSFYSAHLAARLGRPYAFAGHFAPGLMMQSFEIYRSKFKPSEFLKEPYVMAGIPVFAAETDEQAEFLSTSVKQMFLDFIRGDRSSLGKPPVKDMDALWSRQEKAAVESMLGLLVVGSPKKIRRELDDFIQRSGADELIITSEAFDPKDRLRSFELIAEAKKI